MLTRALLVLVLLGGSLALLQGARGEAKLLALGLTDHVATEADLVAGKTLPKPKFNTPGIAYVLLGDLKKGDTVEVSLNNEKRALIANTETLDDDKATFLLHAGKQGVPAGGWPEGAYHAEVKVTRDGKTLIEEKSTPTVFE